MLNEFPSFYKNMSCVTFHNLIKTKNLESYQVILKIQA